MPTGNLQQPATVKAHAKRLTRELCQLFGAPRRFSITTHNLTHTIKVEVWAQFAGGEQFVYVGRRDVPGAECGESALIAYCQAVCDGIHAVPQAMNCPVDRITR
jgi:hypothetical protein